MTKNYFRQVPPEQAAAMQSIVEAALAAADPRIAVRRALEVQNDELLIAGQRLALDGFRRIRVVGAGKASPAMTLGLLDVLGDRLSGGAIIAKHAPREQLPQRIRVLMGGHPVPTQESASSTRALVELLRGGAQDDLVFCLISGGGSALMTLPVEGVPFEDMQNLTRQLLACGANIGEMNTLRKHLDQVKGGGLARIAAPARLVTLILSDVIGSPLDVIASGPAVPDPGTFEDALGILRKYGIEEQIPASVIQTLRRGQRGEIGETVKPGDALLERASNCVVASNVQAAEAAVARANEAGFEAMLLTTYLQGEAAQAGYFLAALLRQVHSTGQPLRRPACIIAGGETTVTIRGSGRGGRNQEMALAAAFLLEGVPDVALVALGTDGEDGPTDAAGAVVTGDTLRRARQSGLDPQAYLQNNDSYAFFASLGDLIKTGPTGTNVNDLAFLFAF
jgi:hydroxypyruvate reductase